MRKIIIFCAVVLIVIASASYARVASAETVAGFSPDEDRFFCGYCHILTYPRVIKKAHASWKSGKHKDVPCADCHYPKKLRESKIPGHRRIPTDERGERERRTEMEFMKTELEVLSRLLTVINLDEAIVVRRPKLEDQSCTSAKCHPTTGIGKEGEYWEKKIKIAEYDKTDKSKGEVNFVHKPHYDKKKWIKGDVIHCTTCHQRTSEKKHFEVSRDNCYLCHFALVKLNEGRSKCEICHKVPTEPLQKQKKAGADEDEKPITHKSLEENKVACDSCHGHLFKGKGELDTGKCLNCHDNEKSIMKEANNLKLMHREHVAGQNARCFECHAVIEHKKADYLDAARLDCKACHPDHHIMQKRMLLGEAREGVPRTPALMGGVTTNCNGCHGLEKIVKGEKVSHGAPKKCAACHTEKHEKMPEGWKDKIAEEMEVALEIEQEALNALKKAEGKLSKEKAAQAAEMLRKGQENLDLVKFGGGVHNKKYSIMLIDEALNNLEDLVDMLAEGEE